MSDTHQTIKQFTAGQELRVSFPFDETQVLASFVAYVNEEGPYGYNSKILVRFSHESEDREIEIRHVDGVIEEDCPICANVADQLAKRNLPVKPCGLNADWSVEAWHLSAGEPNKTSGDYYLTDDELQDNDGHAMFSICQRFYTADLPNGDGNDTIVSITPCIPLTVALDIFQHVLPLVKSGVLVVDDDDTMPSFSLSNKSGISLKYDESIYVCYFSGFSGPREAQWRTRVMHSPGSSQFTIDDFHHDIREAINKMTDLFLADFVKDLDSGMSPICPWPDCDINDFEDDFEEEDADPRNPSRFERLFICNACGREIMVNLRHPITASISEGERQYAPKHIEEKVVDELDEHDTEGWTIGSQETGGGTTCVVIEAQGVRFNWGTADDTWGASIDKDDGGTILDNISVNVPSTSADVKAIAEAIYGATVLWLQEYEPQPALQQQSDTPALLRPVKLVGNNYEASTLAEATAIGIYIPGADGLPQHLADIHNCPSMMAAWTAVHDYLATKEPPAPVNHGAGADESGS